VKIENNGFWADFISFALRGNVVDLAIAVIVGGAFAKITNSIVNDILMPLINPLIPGGDWRSLQVGPGLKIGQFAGTVLDFVLMALFLFLLIRSLGRLRRRTDSSSKPSSVK
jgi:large conductance mechanosensitive channel